MKEAIILASGEGLRLKGQTFTIKPLLKLNGETLIDFQIKWLRVYGFDRIIVPSKEPIQTSFPVVHVEEKERLGTGGAVKLALDEVQGERVYVMNVDDIVFYDPMMLMREAYLGGAILVSQKRSDFGKVEFDNADNVVRFEEKPYLPWYVNVGHYAFKKDVVKEYLPDKGSLEYQALQYMASAKKLRVLEYTGDWITINTFKDLKMVRKKLNEIKRK